MASGSGSWAFRPTSPRPRPTSRASAAGHIPRPNPSVRGRRALRPPVQAGRGGRPQGEGRRRRNRRHYPSKLKGLDGATTTSRARALSELRAARSTAARTPAGAPGRTTEELPSARGPAAAGAAPATLRRPTGKTGEELPSQ
ncbi:hypothetical protein PVAP13_3KG177127 [Panicum virgatum]|uniref:Uncharacterized protein n=1 Tax=Panicum virgatum TaxID=38727 RepID=A0A8T0UVT1_PANVG|nr:hypothetical protein PVAP13_3KG177127 [Panicum virgatum]